MANGLINLQTDLKSLRYGSDKPYVTKNIGQAPGSQLGMEVQSRIDDTSRIAQMLIDKPGIKYLLHEAQLQQINVANKIKNRGNKTVAGAVLGQLGNTLVGTAKILGSTLAQVPVNGTGLHFLKGFRTDTYLQPTNGNQASGFAQFFGAGGIEGAPLALQGKPIEGIVESKFGQKISPVEFKVTAESNLDYDEKVNTLIPNISSYVYAKEGTTIIEDNVGVDGWKPYTNTGVKEQFVDRNTNKILSQSKFIDPAVQNKSRIKPSGSVVSSAITLSNPFGGAPLSIPGIQTTVTPGVKTSQNLITGSLSNKDVKHDLGDNGVGVNQKYTSTSTYTGKNSVYNISQALTGSSVIPTGGEQPTDLIKGISINQSKSEPQYEKSHETPTPNNEYGYGKTYYQGQQNRKIGSSTMPAIREVRVALGDQGKNSKAKTSKTYWTNPEDYEIDQINSIDVTTDKPDGVGAGRDLAKLYFEIITPDAKPRFLYFRAFIDNFDDGYTADWQAHKYVGRAENFYTYGGFDRDITLSFKVAAATRVEMKPLYKKMVYLASATAPTYGGMMTKYMRGTFAKMTVGSYLDQTPGVITSVKYNLIEGMPWEIAMGQPEGVEPESQVLPMGMQCAVTFRPIHTFAPQTGLYPYFTNASQDPRYFTEDDAVLT
jgi:hypothetical protein